MPDSDPIAAALPEVARRLETHAASQPASLLALREGDLSDVTKDVLGRLCGTTVNSRVIHLPDWPGMGKGGTDIVVDHPPGSDSPSRVAELKWCQQGNDKVYEAIWDLFKMALTLRLPGVVSAHLVTGAPADMWPQAFCRDLFDGGTFETEELCRREFPTSPSRRIAWDYLLQEGYDRYPNRVPALITTTSAARAEVSHGSHHWQLRAVLVSVAPGPDDVPFKDGWPRGARPPDARRPAPPGA